MRDSNRHSQPEAEAQPRHDKHVLRMVERLLSALDPEGENITPEDRQLIADVLHYGTFAQISAVRDIPIQTLSYRYCRVLNRLEEAIVDAGLNTASNRRISVLEAKLADIERLLKESQEECASLKEQLNSNTSHRLTAADKRLAKLQEECDSLKEQLSRRTSHRLAVTEEKLAAAERRLELSRQKCANLNEQLKDARKYALPDLPDNLRERLNIKLSDLSLDSSTRNFLAAHALTTIEDVVRLSKDDFRSIFGLTLRGLKMEQRLRLMGLEVGMDLSEI